MTYFIRLYLCVVESHNRTTVYTIMINETIHSSFMIKGYVPSYRFLNTIIRIESNR